MKRIPKINSWGLGLIGILLCLPIVWQYLQPNFFHLHDFTHVARLAELERGILEGQLPVRWSQNLGYGYGMPQFSFYGPMFYYEALIFRLFNISFIWSIKFTVILQLVISFIWLFKLGKLLWGKWGGFLTAIAGIYAPYRLVDMYVRGAFAELSGMTFLVLALYLIVWWAKNPTWRKAALVSISGAGIVLSHSLMALICFPFVAIWLGFWTTTEKRWRHYFQQVVIMGILAFGLAAFFAIPALLEKGYTQADQLTTGFSNYNHHFLYIRQLWQSAWGYGGSIWGIEDNVTFELGKTQIAILVTAFVLNAVVLFRRKRVNGVIVILGLLLGLSLFLSILKSKPIWDLLPFMLFVQFPWRYLSVAIILTALLVGSIFLYIPKHAQGKVALILSLIIMATQINHLKPEQFLDDDQALYYSDEASIQTKMSEIIPDFLPLTAEPKMLPVGVVPDERFSFYPEIENNVEVNRGHEFLIGLKPNQPIVFTASIFDFPGWSLYYNGQKLNHTTSIEGLIQAEIPPSPKESYLSGKFEETPIRRIADAISMISMIIVIGLCYPSLNKKEKLWQ